MLYCVWQQPFPILVHRKIKLPPKINSFKMGGADLHSFVGTGPISEVDFQPKDEFTVADFFECLSFGVRGLHLRTDYVRGRSMKTEVTIRPDGTVTLTTWGRGKSALRWLDQLQGKKRIAEVPSD